MAFVNNIFIIIYYHIVDDLRLMFFVWFVWKNVQSWVGQILKRKGIKGKSGFPNKCVKNATKSIQLSFGNNKKKLEFIKSKYL